MTQEELEAFVLNLENVEREENMGYVFFFVGEYHMVPFATIGYADNVGDNVSQLDRPGIYRLNVGISKNTFNELFPDYNPATKQDYTVLDTFMPHPHYAAQSYICILNPSQENEAKVKRLIAEAHSLAKQREELRNRGKE